MDSVTASRPLPADTALNLMPNDMEFMQAALDLAKRAAAEGEVPVAALVVADNEVLSQAYNRREQWQDPTAHAELIAIREAAVRLGTWRLTGATLYVTLEPCAMCIGAVILSRISRLVYGARDPKAGACGSVFDIPLEPRLNHRVEVQGGVGEEESQSLLQDFFRQLRKDAGIDTIL
jgi:tRNA(adenine34) deaminase